MLVERLSPDDGAHVGNVMAELQQDTVTKYHEAFVLLAAIAEGAISHLEQQSRGRKALGVSEASQELFESGLIAFKTGLDADTTKYMKEGMLTDGLLIEVPPLLAGRLAVCLQTYADRTVGDAIPNYRGDNTANQTGFARMVGGALAESMARDLTVVLQPVEIPVAQQKSPFGFDPRRFI